MKFALCVAILFLLAAGPVRAGDWEGIYEGTIGKLAIQALLLEAQTGAYSYGSKPYDLSLIPTSNGALVTFTEASTPKLQREDIDGERKDEISGSWTISFDGPVATGIWKDAEGRKALPIKLHRLELLADLGKGYGAEDAYHATWAHGIAFLPPQKSVSGVNRDVGEAKDPVFNSAYPRYLTHPVAGQLAKINAFLEQQHRAALTRQRSCVQGARRFVVSDPSDPEFDYQISHSVTYASPTVISIVESGSAFCGGAHPNNYSISRTFDMAALDHLGSEPYAGDWGQWGRVFDIRSPDRLQSFSDLITNRWKSAAAKPGADDDAQCASGGIDGETPVFDLYLVPEGLAVSRTGYPHVMSVCIWQSYNPTIIPWSELRPFARPDQDLLPELK